MTAPSTEGDRLRPVAGERRSISLRSLRRLNAGLAALHAGQGAAMLALSSAFSLRVAASTSSP